MPEAVSVARRTGCAVHVEHINSTGGTGRMAEAIAQMEAGRAEGLALTACTYPYTYWATYARSTRFNDFQEKYDISYEDLQVAGETNRLDEAGWRRAHDDNKLTAAFNYDSTGPEWGYRGPGDKEAYNPDPAAWGHKVMAHVQDDFMTKIVDGLEHSGYWEHEEITDEMMARNKATAAKYGLTFELFPSRYGMLEGKYVLWGNQGDYGLQGYNERWGGLPTFRKYIADLKALGYIATLYINKAEAGFDNLLGKAHGPDWATMYPEGHYFWPYYDWQMCMDHQPWRDYLAQTCARIIEETGGDGVRIDELGGA